MSLIKTFLPVSEYHLDLVQTPVQEIGGIFLKRDDLCEPVPGARGGKARTIYALAKHRRQIITAGGRGSRQIKIAALIGKHLEIPVRVHVPDGQDTPEMIAAQEAGATLIKHRPGYTTVVTYRAHQDAVTQSIETETAEVPYACICHEHIRQTAAQVAALIPYADRIKRIVVPVGSGMTISAVMNGLRTYKLDIPIAGITCGASPEKQIGRFAPDWVELFSSGIDYHDEVHARIGDIDLDPIYEGKCVRFLQPGDLLWIVG